MNQTAKARMRQECKDILAEFGIPVDEYDAGEIDGDPKGLQSVTYTHRRTGRKVVVTEVVADNDGRVPVAGRHYGALEF
jgi:hypothetical protein